MKTRPVKQRVLYVHRPANLSAWYALSDKRITHVEPAVDESSTLMHKDLARRLFPGVRSGKTKSFAIVPL